MMTCPEPSIPGGRKLVQRDYEVMVILSPEVPDEELPATVERVQKMVTDLSGEIVSAEPWGGRRKLAYPISRFREGNYYLLRLKLESTQTTALERSLRINERVIRHLLVSLEN